MQPWLYLDKTPVSPVDELAEVRPGEYEFQIPAPMLDSYESLNRKMTLEDGPIHLKCLRWGYQTETVHINAVEIGDKSDPEDDNWLLINGRAVSQIELFWNGHEGQHALIDTSLNHWDELGLFIDCAKCRMQWCTTDLGALCYNYNVVPIACFECQQVQILRLKQREVLNISFKGTELEEERLGLLVKVHEVTALSAKK